MSSNALTLLRNQWLARHHRHPAIIHLRRRLERRAERYIAQRWFWPVLRDYLHQSESTGCDWIDYFTLYRTVRNLRPRTVLECGTGVSTVVLAAALAENSREGSEGEVISMEDQAPWFDLATRLFPPVLAPNAELVFSERSEFAWGPFRGMGYARVPDRSYQLVWVDGPNPSVPSDGSQSFDFDFLNVVRRSKDPVRGIVDGRVITCAVLQSIFGHARVRHDYVTDLCTVGPVTSRDLDSERLSMPLTVRSSISGTIAIRLAGQERRVKRFAERGGEPGPSERAL